MAVKGLLSRLFASARSARSSGGKNVTGAELARILATAKQGGLKKSEAAAIYRQSNLSTFTPAAEKRVHRFVGKTGPRVGWKNGQRTKIQFGDVLNRIRGRGKIRLTQDVTVLSSNGQPRTLAKGSWFFFGGVKDGKALIYSDRQPGGADRSGGANPDGTTFFGEVPVKYIRARLNKQAAFDVRIGKSGGMYRKSGGQWVRIKGRTARVRGALQLHGNYRTKARTISPTTLPWYLAHGRFDSPLWEYGRPGAYRPGPTGPVANNPNAPFVAGAEIPPSFKGRRGTGYTPGMFRAGEVFRDVGGQRIATPIRDVRNGQTGKAYWVYGYVVRNGAKLYTWMLDGISIGNERFRGTLS